MTILDGKSLSLKIQDSLKLQVSALSKKPKLVVILVGADAPSLAYVNMKAKACENVGIIGEVLRFGEEVEEGKILHEIARLNADKSVNGILVQLPLPKHFDTDKILESISPHKDVDGFHPINVGRVQCGFDDGFDDGFGDNFDDDFTSGVDCKNSTLQNQNLKTDKINIQSLAQKVSFSPATPLGIMKLLKAYNIELKGKNVAIIGASNIVGKPLAQLMLNAGATISICHIFTRDIGVFTRTADIVCVGVGKVNLITKEHIKEGAIIIDIGINRLDNGLLCGDVDFAEVSKKASFITPVPGGVGPMTIAALLANTLKAYKIQNP